MEKGMIFQYVIIGVVFVCIVVYVVWKVKNGGKTGGCSCCDIKDCKLKQAKKKEDCCKCCENDFRHSNFNYNFVELLKQLS